MGRRLPTSTTPQLRCPYLAPPVGSLTGMIERLEEIQSYTQAHEPRGPHDGVACFSFLLQSVTTRISEEATTGRFTDPEFVQALHLALANRYLAALRESRLTPPKVPLAWSVFFDRRDRQAITRVQFAAAGLNAQFGFDLVLALVDIGTTRGSGPAAGAQYRSCQELQAVSAEELAALRDHFETTWERLVDQMIMRRTADRIDAWQDASSRHTAWEWAQRLLDLRARNEPEQALLDHLDELVGDAGRSVLAPVLSQEASHAGSPPGPRPAARP